MTRFIYGAIPAIAILAWLPSGASAQPQVGLTGPTVAYYAPPPPVVSYYYAPQPAVSYYYTPTTAYYGVPAAPTVTRYRLGLLGRRSVTTVNYGAAPVYAPAPITVQRYYPPVTIYP